MNNLWNYIDNKNLTVRSKYAAVLLILSIIFAVVGMIIWLFVRIIAFSTIDWMLCFIGYPVIFSWFLVIIYSCRHEFRDTFPDQTER